MDVLSKFLLIFLDTTNGFTISPLLHLLVHLVFCFGHFVTVVLCHDLLEFLFFLDSSKVSILFGLDEVDDLLPVWLPLDLLQEVFLPNFISLSSLADTLARGHVAMVFVHHESVFVTQDLSGPHNAQGQVYCPSCILYPLLLEDGQGSIVE